MEVADGVARTDAAGGLADPVLHQVLDGALAEGSGDPVEVLDPTTGGVLARGPAAGAREVDLAVRTARRAQERSWGKAAGLVRTRHLLALARAVSDRADELAALETLDTGTPRSNVREQSLPTTRAHLLHHAGWADKLAHAGLGSAPDGGSPRAVGVSLHLLDRAASLSDVVRTVAPALAAGCAVVVAAPARTPLASVALGRLALEAGFPPGVLTVLVAGPSTWPLLVSHKGFDVITMTGSAPAAAALQRSLVGTPARLHTHVRGDDVVIALGEDDHTRDAALGHAISALRTHGRRPAGALRLVVPTPDLPSVLERLRTRLAALRVGDPADPGTEVGPLSDPDLLDQAQTALAAEPHSWTAPGVLPAAGWFLAPSLVVDPARSTPGPVLAVHGYADAEHLRTMLGGDRHATLRLLAADTAADLAAAWTLATSLRGVTMIGSGPCVTPRFVGPAEYLDV